MMKDESNNKTTLKIKGEGDEKVFIGFINFDVVYSGSWLSGKSRFA
jgi:hypothetical protein